MYEEMESTLNLKDPRLIAKCIRDNFEDFKVRASDIQYVGEGMDNVVYRTKSGYLFRFSKNGGTSLQNYKEVQVLPLLQKSLDLAIPKIEYAALQPNGFYFVGYKSIEGSPFDNNLIASLDPEGKSETIESLAKFLSQLRAFPTDTARNVGIIDRNLKRSAETIWKDYQEEFTSHFTQAEQEALTVAFRGYLSNEDNFVYEPCLVHGDLGPDHILYDKKAAKIAGVIDWSDMVITDPAFEIQDLYQNYGEDFTRQVLQRMGAHSESELQKASFFTISRNLQRYMRRKRRGTYAPRRILSSFEMSLRE